jgi:hypothetical protein
MKFFLLFLTVFYLSFHFANAQQSYDAKTFRHKVRAERAYETNNYTDALKEYEEVIKITPNDAEVWCNMAVICESMKTANSLKLAIEYYTNYRDLASSEKKDMINTKIYEIEYDLEKEEEYKTKSESLLGKWRYVKNGKIDSKIEISQFENMVRVRLLKTSSIYTNWRHYSFVSTTEFNRGSLLFSFENDETVTPNPAKQAGLSSMNSQISSLGSTIGSVIGGTAGSLVSSAVSAAGQMGTAFALSSEVGYSTLDNLDFKITYFSNDTLKGYKRHIVNRAVDGHNSHVITDEIENVTFVKVTGTDDESIIKIGKYYCYKSNTALTMDKLEFSNLLKMDCPEAYMKFNSAKKTRIAGFIVLPLYCIGIPLLISSAVKAKKALKIYNENCANPY